MMLTRPWCFFSTSPSCRDSTNRESPIRSSDLTAISFEPRLERGSYSWSQINYNEHLNASSSAVCPTFATFKSSSSSWRQNYAQKLDRTSRSPILSISISKVLTSCTPLSNSPFDSIYAATSTLIPSRFILLFPFSRILRLLTQTVPPFFLFIEFFYFRMFFSQLMRPTRHRQSCLFWSTLRRRGRRKFLDRQSIWLTHSATFK